MGGCKASHPALCIPPRVILAKRTRQVNRLVPYKCSTGCYLPTHNICTLTLSLASLAPAIVTRFHQLFTQ
jgi:hypothetical protein